MAGISKITLVGHLGRDPETRYTPNGAMNISFSMAVSRKAGGEERTTWFSVTAWNKLAEVLDSLTQNGYLTKGKQVFVLGNLETREYTGKDGQTRTSLDVRADEVQLLGSRGGGDGEGSRGVRPRAEPAQHDPFDDVPF
jgi:single-strand DNA-binding protein